MAAESVTCIFCDQALSGANRTREHVLPEWLRADLGISDAPVSQTHLTRDLQVDSTREHTLDTFVAGRVCRTCNNGWMSGLETQVRPILSGLMNNEAEILDCDAKAKLILARWTAKTAYVLNYASNLPTKVPSQDLRDLYKDMTTLPAGVAVFAQQHEATKDYGWLQSPTWPSLLMPKEMAGLLGQGRWIHPKVPRSVSIEAPFEDEIRDPNSYKIGLQLKSLLLLVAYHPRYLEWCYRLWKGVHIPLWPQSGQVTWEERPSEDFAAYDSEEALWRFQLSLGLTLFLDKNPYDSP